MRALTKRVIAIAYGAAAQDSDPITIRWMYVCALPVAHDTLCAPTLMDCSKW